MIYMSKTYDIFSDNNYNHINNFNIIIIFNNESVHDYLTLE
jgi:hypothetical protein